MKWGVKSFTFCCSVQVFFVLFVFLSNFFRHHIRFFSFVFFNLQKLKWVKEASESGQSSTDGILFAGGLWRGKQLWVSESNRRWVQVSSPLGGAQSLWKHLRRFLSQFRGLKSEVESATAATSSWLEFPYSPVLLPVLVLIYLDIRMLIVPSGVGFWDGTFVALVVIWRLLKFPNHCLYKHSQLYCT